MIELFLAIGACFLVGIFWMIFWMIGSNSKFKKFLYDNRRILLILAGCFLSYFLFISPLVGCFSNGRYAAVSVKNSSGSEWVYVYDTRTGKTGGN